MSDARQQISKLLRSQNTFLVLTHYRPDGDAVGSQLALLLLLKNLGKTAEAWNEQVNRFDVTAFANQLASTGARRDAVAAASQNPARAAQIANKGALAAGADADFIVLNAQGQVLRTFVGGVECTG